MQTRTFDTAEAYDGANERLVGKAVTPFREEVVIATKFGCKNGIVADGLDSRLERIRADGRGGGDGERPDCRRQGALFRPVRSGRGL